MRVPREKCVIFLQLKEQLLSELNILKRLAEVTEDEVDKDVFNNKTRFITKIKEMKKTHLNTMSDLAAYKTKYSA